MTAAGHGRGQGWRDPPKSPIPPPCCPLPVSHPHPCPPYPLLMGMSLIAPPTSSGRLRAQGGPGTKINRKRGPGEGLERGPPQPTKRKGSETQNATGKKWPSP